MAFHKLALLSTEKPFIKYEEIVKSKYKYKATLYGTDDTKSVTYNIVKDCYSFYEENINHLENIRAYPNFDNTQKDALLHCYNGNTKKVRELKTSILNNQNIYYKVKCAYCGIGDTNYMDHFIPKDDFPEYAIHSYNLVPSCSYCNEKKSDLFLDNDGFRKVFNPYFEEIGDEPILKCDLECLETTIKTHLKLKDNITNKVWINHLITLNLISRYEDELPRILSTIIIDIIANSEENNIDADGAKRVLRRKLKECEKIQGVNSLDAIVYRAYLDNTQLFEIDYIKRIYFTMHRHRFGASAS